MSATHEYDVVKAEKADALRRYNKRKKRLHLSCRFLRLLPCLLLFLCFSSSSSSWSLPSTILDLSSFSQYYFHSYHLKVGNSSNNTILHSRPSQHLLPFLLLNAVVFLVYLLSAASPDRSKNDVAAVSLEPHSGLPDQCVSLPSASCDEPECGSPGQHVTTAVDDGDRYMVAPRTYRRTKSDASAVVGEGEQKKPLRGRRMQRSETEKGRELAVVTSPGGSPDEKKSMEEMNNEEFRMTIERFIASKRRVLMEEKPQSP